MVLATSGICVLSMAVVVYALWHLVTERPLSAELFYSVVGVEILLVVHLIGGCIALAQTSRDLNGGWFVARLVLMVVVPVAAVMWGLWHAADDDDDLEELTALVMLAMFVVAMLCVAVIDQWTEGPLSRWSFPGVGADGTTVAGASTPSA